MMNDAMRASEATDAVLETIDVKSDASGEAMESEIFWAMSGRGYSTIEANDAIDALLDRGAIASTVRQTEYGFKACLRRAA